MTERQGLFTIPTLLYLSSEHRERLEQLVRAQEIELAELVSHVVAEFLDELPIEAQPPESAPADSSGELQQRRAELARLRAQHANAGAKAPDWLGRYIAELEADVRRLEG